MAEFPILHDEPTLDDLLDRKPQVRELGDRIARCEPPQVFGVHGDWGSGKTSFLQQLQWYLSGDTLDGSERAGGGKHAKKVTTVWFEAWRYQHDGAPIVADDDLSRYASEPVWRETLIFLAELLADDPEWPSVLAELLFGDDFQQIASAASSGEEELMESRWKAQLLAELLVDPHSGWQQSERNSASQVLWAWNAAWQATDASWHPGPRDLVLSILTRAQPPALEPVEKGLKSFLQDHQPKVLRLTGKLLKSYLASGGAHLPPRLELVDARDLATLPLEKLHNLQSLDLQGTQVQDLKPIEKLHNLQSLDLHGTRVDEQAVQDLPPSWSSLLPRF